MTHNNTSNLSNTSRSTTGTHHIVIVGGGAGGLSLATQLGKKLGKKGQAEVTLVPSPPLQHHHQLHLPLPL